MDLKAQTHTAPRPTATFTALTGNLTALTGNLTLEALRAPLSGPQGHPAKGRVYMFMGFETEVGHVLTLDVRSVMELVGEAHGRPCTAFTLRKDLDTLPRGSDADEILREMTRLSMLRFRPLADTQLASEKGSWRAILAHMTELREGLKKAVDSGQTVEAMPRSLVNKSDVLVGQSLNLDCKDGIGIQIISSGRARRASYSGVSDVVETGSRLGVAMEHPDPMHDAYGVMLGLSRNANTPPLLSVTEDLLRSYAEQKEGDGEDDGDAASSSDTQSVLMEDQVRTFEERLRDLGANTSSRLVFNPENLLSHGVEDWALRQLRSPLSFDEQAVCLSILRAARRTRVNTARSLSVSWNGHVIAKVNAIMEDAPFAPFEPLIDLGNFASEEEAKTVLEEEFPDGFDNFSWDQSLLLAKDKAKARRQQMWLMYRFMRDERKKVGYTRTEHLAAVASRKAVEVQSASGRPDLKIRNDKTVERREIKRNEAKVFRDTAEMLSPEPGAEVNAEVNAEVPVITGAEVNAEVPVVTENLKANSKAPRRRQASSKA